MDTRINEFGILLSAIGLWFITFSALIALARGTSPSLSKRPVQCGLLIVSFLVGAWLLAEMFLGRGLFEVIGNRVALWVLLAVIILAVVDRSGKYLMAATLPIWYLALILLTVEGLFGSFFVTPILPRTEKTFQSQIIERHPYPLGIEKPPGVYRVLALGDSFGIAHGENNYHFLLHRRFEKEGIPIEVLNVSAPAIEPLDQWRLLSEFGEQYSPDLVLQSFFVGNDFYIPKGEYSGFGGVMIRSFYGLQGWKPENFLLPLWVRTKRKAHSDRAKRIEQEKHGNPVGTFNRDDFLKMELFRLNSTCRNGYQVDRYLGETIPILDSIKDEAERIGAKYALAILPDQFQVDPALFEELVTTFRLIPEHFELKKPQRFIDNYSVERGIPTCDLLPRFLSDERQDLFLLEDSHYNEKGNELVAQMISEFIHELHIAGLPRDSSND